MEAVNMELAYKVQMLPASIRESRSLLETKLLGSGWPRDILERDLPGAMRWASSHCLTQSQEKTRRTRAHKKTILKGNAAVEAMFGAAGVKPDEILPKI